MKHKVKQYILRAAPLILVCCMFVFVLSSSASAEALNYRDYEKYVTVDGDNDLVTLDFPYEDWMNWYFAPTNLSVLEHGSGYSFYVDPDWMYNHNHFFVLFAPFGGSTFSYGPTSVAGHYLATNNIPSDAKWSLSLNVWMDDEASSFVLDYFNVRNWVVDGDSRSIYSESGADSITEVDNGIYDIRFSGDVVSGFDGWAPQFLLSFSSSPSPFIFNLNSFVVTMSISSLYRLQEETGKTNELLDEVNKQLAEQGKTMQDVLDQQEQTNNKLDDIINGEVAPEAPEGADRIDDLDQAEGELRDEAQIGLDEGVQIQQNVLQILEQYANGFAVFSWLFGLFAKQPFITGLLYVSLSLGTVGSILNLGLSFDRASRAKAGKSKKGG